MASAAELTGAAWDRIAAGYDELITPANLDIARTALRRAGLAPGMRFLDVAAGTGALAIPAAQLGAEVLAVDVSLAMIDRLEMRARADGLSNLVGRVMDGQALALEDALFDVTGSQFGVMLPDEQSILVLRVDRGLRWDEVARILHDEGEPDEATVAREASNLRQRFRQLKERLREMARAEGLLDDER